MILTSQAARVAFILNVLDSMTRAEIVHTLEQEVQPRRRYAPCVAENLYFPSTIAAAHYLAHHRQDLWVNSKAAQRQDAHAVMENLRNRVKNWCNRDDVFGYYWV